MRSCITEDFLIDVSKLSKLSKLLSKILSLSLFSSGGLSHTNIVYKNLQKGYNLGRYFTI